MSETKPTGKDGREIVWWDCDRDAEGLQHDNREDAIAAWLDGRDLRSGSVVVYGYARMGFGKVEWEIDDVISALLEGQWAELGDPENGPDVTRRMLDAARAFVEIMREEFTVWACEIVYSEIVDVAAWIAKYRPEWAAKRKAE